MATTKTNADAKASGTTDVETLRAFAGKLFPRLDQLSYYQLLNVPAAADAATVRKAYYGIAQRIHPDRFQRLPDQPTREALEIIYARVTEAYRALSSPERRAEYDRGLGEGKLRLDTNARPATTATNPEDALKHPDARKFFRLGMVCLSRKDLRGAVMNFTFARNFEPGASIVAEKLAEAQAALKRGAG